MSGWQNPAPGAASHGGVENPADHTNGHTFKQNGHANGANGATDANGAHGINGANGNAIVESLVPAMTDLGVTWGAKVDYNYDDFSSRERQWDSSARVYEWDGETGDVGPEFPELEIELFGVPKDRRTTGIDFQNIMDITVTQEGPVRVDPIRNFADAGLHPVMLRNIELCGYEAPTPIQAYCIPAIHKRHDVIGIAQTGSGKTAAYLIPIIDKLMGKAKKLAAPRPNPATYDPFQNGNVRAEPLVVIVCPSRELAVQVFNEARKLCYRSMLRPCVIYGGGPIGLQIAELNRGCDILVASPGRLIDFMDRPDVLTLRRVRYMVIDEADEMLHNDWETEFKTILSGGEQEEGNITYMLFSATFPKKIRDLAKTHLNEAHVRLRVGRAGSTHKNITQSIVYSEAPQKKQAVIDLLNSVPPCRTIIFVNSKRMADELDDFIHNNNMPCTSMHSDRTQREREDAMRSFRYGRTPIMITTSVAARGIDVRNVMHVINYDLPSMDHGGIEEYIHRIGRTGRIGHRGLATSLYTERDEPIAKVLTRTLLETKQSVPEFLSHLIPEGEKLEKLQFEADSDYEGSDDEGDNDEGEGGGWGAGAGDDADNAGGETNAWGAGGNDSAAPADNAWGNAGGAAAW